MFAPVEREADSTPTSRAKQTQVHQKTVSSECPEGIRGKWTEYPGPSTERPHSSRATAKLKVKESGKCQRISIGSPKPPQSLVVHNAETYAAKFNLALSLLFYYSHELPQDLRGNPRTHTNPLLESIWGPYQTDGLCPNKPATS